MLLWAWRIVIGVVAICAIFVQVDRHANEVPFYARFVPASFASFSLPRTITKELQNGSPEKALVDARRLVFLHPIPAENLTVLALAELQNTQQDAASRALMLSAQRGWREPLAQGAIALAAEESGDPEIAADRLLALWKTSSESDQTHNLSLKLLRNADVRLNFAPKIAGQQSWQSTFVRWAFENLEAREAVEIFERAGNSGATLSCPQLLGISRSLLNRGDLKLAERAWRTSHCGSGSNSFNDRSRLTNFNLDDNPEPLSWFYPAAAGVSYTINKNATLDFQNTDPIRRVLATRYLALSPGRHSIDVNVDSISSDQSRPMLAFFACRGGVENPQFKPVLENAANRNIEIEVPEQNCPVQLVEIRVTKASAQGVRVVIN